MHAVVASLVASVCVGHGNLAAHMAQVVEHHHSGIGLHIGQQTTSAFGKPLQNAELAMLCSVRVCGVQLNHNLIIGGCFGSG